MDTKKDENVLMEAVEEAIHKVRKLLSLGAPKGKAHEWGNTRKGYWRIAGSPILEQTLNNQYWKTNGLKSLMERYNQLRDIS